MLSDQPQETWGNTILWRLAEALGYWPDDTGGYALDPDEIVDSAVEILKSRYDHGHD